VQSGRAFVGICSLISTVIVSGHGIPCARLCFRAVRYLWRRNYARVRLDNLPLLDNQDDWRRRGTASSHQSRAQKYGQKGDSNPGSYCPLFLLCCRSICLANICVDHLTSYSVFGGPSKLRSSLTVASRPSLAHIVVFLARLSEKPVSTYPHVSRGVLK
jgi:hypothetical protein